ncbi:transposase [Paenibacillus alginolyticus]|uniref:IS4 family transposase n=1 Tax=Paenibacillus alginolyticus TaxID=59839 RepID=UPI00041213B7|nr:transposase [Paenibacillus alginolyticus]MCY9670848.1 transposase [Paenibacillus alginolyticus]
MIDQKQPCNQLPKEIKPAFEELHVLKHLKDAKISKKFGYSAAYLYQLVFVLLFHQKNWFRLLQSEKAESFPGKDAVYRFLNHTKFAWRQFLLSLSTATIHKVETLTSDERVTAFIFDDSMFDRNRSKAVELLARFKDHATGAYYKGFRMLTMGWSDSHSFIPMDFALLSSVKSQINGISEWTDKRTVGYKRREEALLSAPKVIASMIDRAIAAGASASYALMDSWFTHAPLIKEILDRGLHVIGMIKNDNKRYLVGGIRLNLKELYLVAPQVEGKKSDILRCIRTELVAGIPVLVVFIRHRSKKKEWLAILSTDLTLTPQEVISTYTMRWNIEVFFKCAKSMLRLQKEFQGLSYDLLVSHTTIVFSRYILLAWQHRQSTDQRTLGGLFYLLCDEVSTLDWVVALQQLIDLISEVATKASKKLSKLIKSQLQQWIVGLPSYLKAYLPISGCEV